MSRAFLIVLDSVGCGYAPDASKFGDEGANTLGSIANACAEGRADRAGLRKGLLKLPNLAALGLGHACAVAGGGIPPGLECHETRACYGSAIEVSGGKDTPSGHWEMTGVPATRAFGYFPDTTPCFPAEMTSAIIAEAGLEGVLGNQHASGIAIIDELGAEHMATLKPIIYTSVDSVLQIAAHEEAFGLERLYRLCEITRRLVDPLHICRVIARPFTGNAIQGFGRTANRKDFAMPPPKGGLLEVADKARHSIVTLGKIGDIFAHQHTGREIKAAGNMRLFDRLLEESRILPDGGLIFANFVDFDTEFGHRRDVAGYAACLEQFDARLPDFLHLLELGDCLVITADHGNDPGFKGTDHTREQVPILFYRPDHFGISIGQRKSFADIGQSLAKLLGLSPLHNGMAFI